MSLERPLTGRFAPSPTGPLHLGSLVAAVGSFLSARAQGGRWLVRMEDLDEARAKPGAAETILRQLAAHGLTWDGGVEFQSRRKLLYEQALQQLAPWIYPCYCSRKERDRCRCREPGAVVRPGSFHERFSWKMRGEGEVDDFVVRRSDGYFAYQLAVVVDDEDQGVTEVVRGADLLDSTPRQNLLQRRLGYRIPRYLHLPLVCGPDGQKLSKQNRAPALGPDAAANLRAALRFLGQPESHSPDPEAILAGAVRRWDPQRIPPLQLTGAEPRAGDERSSPAQTE